MEKISFTIKKHDLRPGVQIVEILLGGKMIGLVYPDQQTHGIKIVSAYIAETKTDPDFAGRVIQDDSGNKFPPIPAVHITF